MVIPIISFKFFISFIGNILLLLLLIPLLILIVLFISFNSLKTKLITCKQCGSISFGLTENCMNCGAPLEKNNFEDTKLDINPSEKTIEIKAEEIK